MDQQDASPSDGGDLHGLDRQLQENSMEYMIFILGPKLDGTKYLSTLEEVRRDATRLVDAAAENYIWQRDAFNLELVNEQGLVYLRGITDYGDAVEDEWLIVYVLRQLTQSRSDIWVRVADEDGEFLLVEAANVSPSWINPEIDHCRVWINDGKLKIIPPPAEKALPQGSKNISLPDAISYIRENQESLVHSTFVEAEAFYRLEKYPAHIAASIHHSVVTIPRKLAYVLHTLPKSISAGVEAFYLRDHIGMKRITSTTERLEFPPTDLVTVSVAFSRTLFAQLRSQRFEAPPRWKPVMQRECGDVKSDAPLPGSAQKLEDGMKLTCGFEMLSANANTHKSRSVRELAIMLEDIHEDGDDELPTDEDIENWKDVHRNNDESWMDIDFADFERELAGRSASASKQQTNPSFGDASTQEGLRKIVSRFESFLNDETAGLDGAQIGDMDIDNDDSEDEDEDSESEDKVVSFDEETFSRMMKEMMGLPADVPAEKSDSRTVAGPQSTDKGKGAVYEPFENRDKPEDNIAELADQMEAELKDYGALKLDARQSEDSSAAEGSSKRELATFDGEEEAGDDAGGDEVDIDYNLAKNLLESFKSQGGMAGPTGNLLGLMGIQLPRDEDSGEEEGTG
ncbi:hypothetical protein K4F52_008253 [Lecanicillium sp. MT-2017a]|nr:hypothetical protein K4F52_008253 [Lecanicillium sp. MT-2017a]